MRLGSSCANHEQCVLVDGRAHVPCWHTSCPEAMKPAGGNPKEPFGAPSWPDSRQAATQKSLSALPLAPMLTRNGACQGRLAHPGRADEAQDGCTRIPSPETKEQRKFLGQNNQEVGLEAAIL
jgi:hypothetical protein